jgi:hypothetical protein
MNWNRLQFNTPIRWRFEALADWYGKVFGADLPYYLDERGGAFVLFDAKGAPVAPVRKASVLQELILITCAECGGEAACSQLCVDCGKHSDGCCQCLGTHEEDTEEIPRLPMN